MAVLYTWSGLWDMAAREAGLTEPTVANNAQFALNALSAAQHELQQISNAVMRRLTVSVSPILSVDGSYAYSEDVKLPKTWQFLATGSTTALDVRPITFDEMDLQKRLSGTMQPAMPLVGLDLTVSIEGSTFYLWPYQSMTGSIILKYITHLMPYDPANPVGDWVTFGANPFTLMKTTGPAREFYTAIEGMKDYLVMKLMEDKPDLLQRFPARYRKAIDTWERAKQYSVRDQPQMNSRQLFRPRNGVLQ